MMELHVAQPGEQKPRKRCRHGNGTHFHRFAGFTLFELLVVVLLILILVALVKPAY